MCSPNRVLELAGEDLETARLWVNAIDGAVERRETQVPATKVFDDSEIRVYLQDSTFQVSDPHTHVPPSSSPSSSSRECTPPFPSMPANSASKTDSSPLLSLSIYLSIFASTRC